MKEIDYDVLAEDLKETLEGAVIEGIPTEIRILISEKLVEIIGND